MDREVEATLASNLQLRIWFLRRIRTALKIHQKVAAFRIEMEGEWHGLVAS
jgi:hypothetical protein